jgi:hypothetical protein
MPQLRFLVAFVHNLGTIDSKVAVTPWSRGIPDGFAQVKDLGDHCLLYAADIVAELLRSLKTESDTISAVI